MIGIIVAALLLLERYCWSYAVSWIAGALAAGILLVRGGAWDRITLGGLFVLAMLAGGTQTELGLRYCVFFALFAVCARHLRLDPTAHLALQMAFGVLSVWSGTVNVERYVFGTSLLLLLRAVLRTRPEARFVLRERLRTASLIIASLAVALIGFGSRSAVLVWLTVSARRRARLIAALAIIVAVGALVLPAAASIANLPTLRKLQGSASELLTPTADAGQVNMRALEFELYMRYAPKASIREHLLGSRTPILVPGEPLGYDVDARYIPHNQVLGLLYQFGAVGLLLVGHYVFCMLRRYRQHPVAGSFFLALLLPFFLFKHGFLDTDFALLCASLNWVIRGRA